MRGASALNGLLAEFPDARITVLVVWEPVIKTDVAAPLTRVLQLIPDRRVTQFWDPNRLVSADMVRSVNEAPGRYGIDEKLPPDFIVWDVIAIFPPTARWDGALPVPAYYGDPVVSSIDGARKAIADAMRAPIPPS